MKNKVLNIIFLKNEKFCFIEDNILLENINEFIIGSPDLFKKGKFYQYKDKDFLIKTIDCNSYNDPDYILKLGSEISELQNLNYYNTIKFRFDNMKDNENIWLRNICIGFELGRYRYLEFKLNPNSDKYKVEYVIPKNKLLKSILEETLILVNNVVLARDLVNEPANTLFPETYANQLKEECISRDLECQIFNKEDLEKLGMYALLEVSKGSPREPFMTVIRYNGNPADSKNLCIIGKGVTYDSGGLQLKTSSRYVTMKHDMAGSAAAVGAIFAVAENKLKLNMTVVLPMCENMINANAYKPGDIIKTMKGLKIHIKSTDAEGRLTIADGITYAIKHENVTHLIDICSLTSAARIFLGNYGAMTLTNNTEFYELMVNGSKKSREFIWPAPFLSKAIKELKHDIADYSNSSFSDSAKMITAGLFINLFVEDLPWVHVDIAGPCWSNKKVDYITKGGTGFGTMLLYETAKEFSKYNVE